MKISGLSIGKLFEMEDFGYLCLIQEVLPRLPLEAADVGYSDRLKAAADAYKNAYREFDEAVHSSGANSPAAIAARKDKERDSAWRTLRAYVKVCARHPDPDLAAISARALGIVRRYGDLAQRAIVSESGGIHNLIQELREIGATPLKQAGITPFIDDLERKEQAFLEADKHWIEVKSNRTTGIVRLKRRAADATYRDLVTTVNALIHLNGDAPYADFVRPVNALIKDMKTTLAARETVRRKHRHAQATKASVADEKQPSES